MILDNAVPEPNTGCMLWLGGMSGDGYGMVSGAYAHRISYIEVRGPIPTGMVVDHVCNTPLCVNPDHLQLLSRGDNVRRGKRAKLSPDSVAEIKRLRADGVPVKVIAQQFGIGDSTVYNVTNGYGWGGSK